jgi:hypothetical protein
MSGNKKGGELAAITNVSRHGADFYARIGALGGAKGRTGGFGDKKVGKDGLTGAQRAQKAGEAGGRISRRKAAVKKSAI